MRRNRSRTALLTSSLWLVIGALFATSAGSAIVRARSPRSQLAGPEPLVVATPPSWGNALPVVEAPSPAVTAPPGTAAPVIPRRMRATRPPFARPRLAAPEVPVAALEPYRGLGTWVDVYDWSQTYTREAEPAVGPEAVERMAAEGVQTLFLQAAKHDAPADVLEPDRLIPIIERAHAVGIRVVAWYLPSLVDPERDLQRLLAIASLDIDGLAVDIESREVADVVERNRRLVALSTELRASLPGWVIGGIVLPPVVLEEVNRNYWPDFPWRQIASLYDAWAPMGYWTNRRGGWRNAHDYTVENVIRLRRNLGLPEAVVHGLGGIGDNTSPSDAEAFTRAASETHCVGGSLYDWRTTSAETWQPLRVLRV